MEIIPRKKQVLVKQEKDTSKETEFGILKPSNVEEEQKAVGVIVNLGEGIDDLKKGDKVIYGAFAGEKINLKDEEYLLLFDDDVLATIV